MIPDECVVCTQMRKRAAAAEPEFCDEFTYQVDFADLLKNDRVKVVSTRELVSRRAVLLNEINDIEVELGLRKGE